MRNPLTPQGVTLDNINISWIFWRQLGMIQTLEINHMRSNTSDGI